MKEVLFFNSMLTPKLITVIYWFLLVMVLFGGLATMFAGDGIGGFLGGLLMIAFGALAVRIWCELMIVIFKINDNLRRLADKSGVSDESNA